MASSFKIKDWGKGSPIPGLKGAECEYYLIYADTGELADEAPKLLYLIWKDDYYAPLRAHVSPEFYACMIEAKTEGGLPAERFGPSFARILALLIEAAGELGLKLLSTAHYRGSDDMWRARAIFTDPGGQFEDAGERYLTLPPRVPEIVAEPRVPGNISIQSHVGVPLANRRQRHAAVAVSDVLTTQSHLFAVIGANSPSPDGPGDSERLRYWGQLTRSGPYLFRTFSHLKRHATRLMRQGEIERPTELWYVSRLNRQSAELRAVDEQPTMQHLLTMDAFTHGVGMAAWRRAMARQPILLPAIEELEAIDASALTWQRPDQIPFWNFWEGRWSTASHGFERLLEFARGGLTHPTQAQLLAEFECWAAAHRNGAAHMRHLFAIHSTPQEAYLAAADDFHDSVESWAEAAAA